MTDIPIKFVFHGDRQECESLKWQAKRVSRILDNMMQLGELDQRQIKFTPYDGALIVARRFFGTRIVDIYAGPGAIPKPPPDQKVCACNCNISVGWVLEVQEDDTINGAQLYTVMACNYRGTSYVPYYNILASDWTPYVVGQKVILVPYHAMDFLCCTDPRGQNSSTGCRPQVIVDTEKENEEWRPTYRILPWCAAGIPVRLAPQEWMVF